MLKERLLTPGPTPVPQRVHHAMAGQALHHRTDEFKKLFSATADRFGAFVDSPTRPILLAGSATGAMDAALQNLFQSGDKIIVVNAGKFGERWTEIGNSISLNVIEIKVPWGESVDPKTVESTMRAHKDVKAICIQYCETSTAALHPVPEIGKVIRGAAPEALFIVDGVTAVGTLPVSMKDLYIDALVVGSQKALMLPPGLALLALSERAWARVEARKPTTYYLNLLQERKAHTHGMSAWTPAISLIAGLSEVLNMFDEETPAQIFARHAHMARIAQAGVAALGFNLFAKTPAPGVTSALPPAPYENGDALRKETLKVSGVRLAGGQEEFKGKMIRIGHMGYCDTVDVMNAIAGLELGMARMNPKYEPGAGVCAALAELKKG